jgi:hypothetical protein
MRTNAASAMLEPEKRTLLLTIVYGHSGYELDCSTKVSESSAMKTRRILVSLLRRRQKRLINCSQV